MTDERLREVPARRRRNLVPALFEFALDSLFDERLGCLVAVFVPAAVALTLSGAFHPAPATRRLDASCAVERDDA